MIWKPIPHWPLYEASETGIIRNAKTGRVIKTRLGHGIKYLIVDLHTGKRWGLSSSTGQTTHLVHVLVCSAFHGERPSGMDVAHGDGNHQNNAASNLRWATRSDNMRDKSKHGTERRGEARFGAKLTADQVLAIRADPRPEKPIAADYGISTGTVGKIRRREKWTHI